MPSLARYWTILTPFLFGIVCGLHSALSCTKVTQDSLRHTGILGEEQAKEGQNTSIFVHWGKNKGRKFNFVLTELCVSLVHLTRVCVCEFKRNPSILGSDISTNINYYIEIYVYV